MQKYSKLSLIIFLVCTFCISIYITAAIYINDPLQIWHKPFYKKERYSHMRVSAKALIRNNEFNSVIIGNSHSENTSAKTTEKFLGGKFFNLSMSGSSMREKRIILNYLFKQKDIKKVVYITDIHYLKLPKNSEYYPINSYDFLYNDNPHDDYKIYLNSKYLPCAVGLTKISSCTQEIENMDRPYAWDNNFIHTERFGGFDNWVKCKNNRQIKEAFQTILETPQKPIKPKYDKNYQKELQAYVDEYLLKLVKSNPNIEFNIIIPPVSNLELAIEIRNGNFYKTELLLKYIAQKSSEYPNLKIFAFDNLKTIGKIEDFKDLTHYRTWVNEYCIKAIAENKHYVNEHLV